MIVLRFANCLWQGGIAQPETHTRIVVLQVIQAKGLQAADANGTSDAFVTVQLEAAISTRKLKTKVIKSTLEPVWDQKFRIPVQGRVGQLKLQVYDHDVLSANDFLGIAKISLHMLEPGGDPVEEWIALRGDTDNGPATGEINIKVWMEVEDGPPNIANDGKFARFAGKKRDDDGITDPDDIDLGFFFNIEPPLDARKLAARKAAEERENKLRAKELAMSREEKERQIRARTERPEWKDDAWQRWSAAGATFQYVFDRGAEVAGKVHDLYRNATDYELLITERTVSYSTRLMHAIARSSKSFQVIDSLAILRSLWPSSLRRRVRSRHFTKWLDGH